MLDPPITFSRGQKLRGDMPKDKLLRNQKLRAITLERAEKFVSKDYWSDVNLFSKLYKTRKSSCVSLSVYSVPYTDVNHTDKVSFQEAMKCEFEKVEVGKEFGPSWSTHWFKGVHSLQRSLCSG